MLITDWIFCLILLFDDEGVKFAAYNTLFIFFLLTRPGMVPDIHKADIQNHMLLTFRIFQPQSDYLLQGIFVSELANEVSTQMLPDELKCS